MSHIDELIHEHCPNGVPFQSLGHLVSINSSGVDKKSIDGEQEVRLLNFMDVYRNVRISRDSLTMLVTAKESQIKSCSILKNDIFITPSSETPDDIGHAAVAIEDLPNCVFSYHVHRLRLKDTQHINPHFLQYLFRSSQIQGQISKASTGMTRFGLTKAKWEALKFPVPPLEIQNEIVRILDTFKLLEAQLEAELEARKKQYDFYRHNLLTPTTNRETERLGEISVSLDSKRVPITKGFRKTGNFPYYGASGVVDYVENYIFNGDYLLVSEDGANLLARTTPIAFSISGKTWVNNHAHVLEFKTYEDRRFVEFYLNSLDLKQFISGSTQPKLNKASLNQIPIPRVPAELKSKIVKILDVFELLVNDIAQGLPAEIQARLRQYEYYRDKLLTFKELA